MVGALPGGDHTIVTSVTASQYLCVIHRRYRHPDLGYVASVALICSGDVSCTPAAGNHAVMTNRTGLGGSAVIKTTDRPPGNDMASITGQRGGQVVYAFARGDHTIVATLAGTNNLFMINRGNR